MKTKDTRPSWDEYYLELCEVVSKRATCDRLHVGAVITKENKVVSVGYNGSLPGMVHCNERRCIICNYQVYKPSIPKKEYLEDSKCPQCGQRTVMGGHLIVDGHCLRTCHAEENAIVYAAREGIKLEGSTLYCTTMPCWNCLKLCVGAGITEVIYRDKYNVSGDVAIQDFMRQLNYTLTKFKIRQFTNDNFALPPGHISKYYCKGTTPKSEEE